MRPRVDRNTAMAGLLAGDLAAIVVLAAIGVAHHRGVEKLADPVYVGLVAAPFVLGWLVVAVPAGLYTGDAIASPVRAVTWTILAWVVAALIGQLLRGSPFFPGGTGPVFALVTVAAGAVLVGGWRTVASLVVRYSVQKPTKDAG